MLDIRTSAGTQAEPCIVHKRKPLDFATKYAAMRKAVEDQLAKKLTDAETAIGATKEKALASVKDIAGETVVAIVSALTSAGASKDEVNRALAAVGAEK